MPFTVNRQVHETIRQANCTKTKKLKNKQEIIFTKNNEISVLTHIWKSKANNLDKHLLSFSHDYFGHVSKNFCTFVDVLGATSKEWISRCCKNSKRQRRGFHWEIWLESRLLPSLSSLRNVSIKWRRNAGFLTLAFKTNKQTSVDPSGRGVVNASFQCSEESFRTSGC